MAEGYEDKQILCNAASDVSGYAGFVRPQNNDIAGFSAGHITTCADALSIPFSAVQDHDKFPLSPTDRVAYLDIVCVSPDCEHRGHGKELHTSLIASLSRYGFPVLTSSSA